MSHKERKKVLSKYLDLYARWPYDKFDRMDKAVVEVHGDIDDADFHQVTVRVLEKNSDESGDWIHVVISIDGRGFLGFTKSTTGSLFVYRDGRVEKKIA